MASMASLAQFPLITFHNSYPSSRETSMAAFFPVNRINFPPLLTANSTKLDRNLAVRAAGEGDFVSESEHSSPKVAVLEENPLEINVLKRQLVDSFYGTNRGLSASSETRAEVVELITQLEAKNPTPAPTEALTLLNGKWILAYTSFADLFPLLSRSANLPLVKLEEISQTIDSENFTVQNSVLFSGPFSSTSISTRTLSCFLDHFHPLQFLPMPNSKFEVPSIKFEEGVIGTPQLTDSIVLPENVEFFGQNIDLTPFRGLLASVQDTASSVARTINSQPPLKFSIANRYAESWLLTTYLDDELRISRDEGGSLFVLIKDGSSLLNP